MAIDETKLNALLEQFVSDAGAVFHAATIVIGDRLGLYKAMDDGAKLTPAELASRTGTDERYVKEWLSAQAEKAKSLQTEDLKTTVKNFYFRLVKQLEDKGARVDLDHRGISDVMVFSLTYTYGNRTGVVTIFGADVKEGLAIEITLYEHET